MENNSISKTTTTNTKLKQDQFFTEIFKENEIDFLEASLNEYLEKLISKKGISKDQIIKDSGIDRIFFFDILSGEINPKRNYVLRILIVLEIPLKNMQWILQATGYAQLYSRDKRDGVIISCINHQNNVNESNAMLEKVGLELI